jgi:excisionase family DNA binding protein
MGTRRMLNVGQAADYIGAHPHSIRKWSDRGLVQVSRTPGGHRRFSTDDLDDLIGVRQHGASPQTDPPDRHRSFLIRAGGRDRRGSST